MLQTIVEGIVDFFTITKDNAAAQVLGLVGFFLAVIGFQQKSRKGILGFQLVCTTVFGIHFIMLGELLGTALNLIASTRAGIFYFKNDKKWAASPLWSVLFIVCSWILSIYCIVVLDKAWYYIFPAIGMTVTTISFSMTSPLRVRALTSLNSPCWTVYNISSGSIAGVVTEATVFVSIIVGIIRHDLKNVLNKKSEASEVSSSECSVFASENVLKSDTGAEISSESVVETSSSSTVCTSTVSAEVSVSVGNDG